MMLYRLSSVVTGFLTLFCVQAFASFPIEINNKSGIDNAQTFLVIKAINEEGDECFMHFSESGTAVCQSISQGLRSSLGAEKPLSALPEINGTITLQLPKVSSGRMYFSYKYPMDLPIDGATQKIIDADGFKPKDSNYYTLYDKVEFTYNDLGTWMNPTAVDFFSLPISIYQSGSVVYQNTGLGLNRKDVFAKIDHLYKTDNEKTASEWQKLILGATNSVGQQVPLRVMAPGKAMVKGIPNTQPFDDTIFTNSEKYGNNGQSYVDEVWSYYRNHSLLIDIGEIMALPMALCDGRVNKAEQFVFHCENGESVIIPKQTTSLGFFAGATGDFDAANNTAKAVVARELTSAMVVGLLPAQEGAVLNREYFELHRDHHYYTKNTPNGQNYDLYAKALHSFGAHNPIYTFAYDDALAQDGTLHDPQAPTTAVITLQPVGLTLDEMPAPFDKTDSLNRVRVVIPKSEALQPLLEVLRADCEVGCEMVDDHEYTVASPLTLKLTNTITGDTYQTVNLYLESGIVRPYVAGSDGIVVDYDKSHELTTLIFPASLSEYAIGEGTTISPRETTADIPEPTSSGDGTEIAAGIVAGAVLNSEGVLLTLSSEIDRDYVILHYINSQNIQQNVLLKKTADGYIKLLTDMDATKPISLTIQDPTKGQFSVNGLSLSNLATTDLTEPAPEVPPITSPVDEDDTTTPSTTVGVAEFTQTGTQSVQVSYQYNNWADVHVSINGQHRGSYRMQVSATDLRVWTVDGVNAGDKLSVTFTTMRQASIGPFAYTVLGNSKSSSEEPLKEDPTEQPVIESDQLSSYVKGAEGEMIISYNNPDWADIHVFVNGGHKGSYRMTGLGQMKSHSVTGLQPGDKVRFYFTTMQKARDEDQSVVY